MISAGETPHLLFSFLALCLDVLYHGRVAVAGIFFFPSCTRFPWSIKAIISCNSTN